MTFISLRPSPLTAEDIAPAPPRPNTLNCVLRPEDDPEWPDIIRATGLDRTECWPRKFERATFQYAHLMKCVLGYHASVKGLRVLMPGGYEDPLAEALKAMGARVRVEDPASGGLVLRDFVDDYVADGVDTRVFDIVLAASVLEHVRDDAEFLSDILTCLRPGGYAFLTCDYKDGWKPGDPLAPTEERLYTEESLMALTDTIAGRVEFADPRITGGGPDRDWQPRGHYFHYGGVIYAFAGIAFRKKGGAQ